MDTTAVEKFINAVGITYNIDYYRGYFYNGERHVCYEVHAYHEGKKVLEEHNCYSLNGSNIKFADGNQVIGPNEGIFKYLGMNKDVISFFEKKTRQMAMEYFFSL